MSGDGHGPDPARITDGASFVREVDLLRRLAARGTGKARVSLTELARSVDLPRSTLHAYVSGKIHPPSDVFDRIVIALRVPRAAWGSWNEAWFRVAAHLHSAKRASDVPRQLPPDAGGFVGRERDLAALDRLVTGSPFLLVTGMPGVGKTALAVHWAHRVASSFPDGQLFANLRGFADARPAEPADVLAGFLRALGVRELPVELDQLAAAFRSAVAGRRVLVVLDDAGSAEQVRPLLPGTRTGAVVITSRTRLAGLVARDGAASRALEPLEEGEALGLLRRVVGPDRADAEPAAAAELAELCGRLPLALRIAGAHARIRPGTALSAMVDELDPVDPLAVLDATLDRETAVRAAIAPSYRVLEPLAQRVFRLFGLLPGGGVELRALAAATRLATDELRAVVRTLLDLHLITEQPLARYAQHALLRSWARIRCLEDDADDDRAAVRLRLITHYAGLATEAAQLRHPRPYRIAYAAVRPEGTSFADAGEALTWFDAEFTTLTTVTRQAAEAGLAALATQLCVALHFEFERRRSAEWLEVSEAALTAARDAGDTAGQVLCLRVLSSAHWSRSDHAGARACLDEAVQLAGELGASDLKGITLSDLGRTSVTIGRLRDAAGYYRQALELELRTSGGASIPNLVVLGDVLWELGELTGARDHYAEAIATATRQEYAAGLQLAESHAGRAAQALGDLPRAVEHYRRGLELSRSGGEHADEASVLAHLAGALRDLGEYEAATATAREALAKATGLAMTRTQAGARHVLGTTLAKLGQDDAAQAELEAALALSTAANHPRGRGDALVALSGVHLRRGAVEEARAAAELARAISEETGHGLIQADSLLATAAVELACGDLSAARVRAGQARALHVAAGCRPGVERADALLG
ncbi:NB-ARC domain-containing protein [Amycolatopsis sp. OK19-0408]|uniref:NB-ARC domain-containing protein n=1 Tax=Amycolatopsis iheyensis TaxID=2945988 RepID=A0A9X2SIG2_9PSEU|nr:helix-turn-helix domain-containing protein [Amycolatopsis iheyensis]MCR6482903.1 NB-ARC domain-containing protein [Amycolatopsis iheyensis]